MYTIEKNGDLHLNIKEEDLEVLAKATLLLDKITDETDEVSGCYIGTIFFEHDVLYDAWNYLDKICFALSLKGLKYRGDE